MDIETSDQTKNSVLNLPKALSVIYQEYMNYQSDKDLWVLERAEYEARLSFLSGELCSMRSLNGDLIKRIKMLEYELKKQRKFSNGDLAEDLPYVNGPVQAEGQPPVSCLEIPPRSISRKRGKDILRNYIMEVTRTENFVSLKDQLAHLRKPIKSLFSLYPHERNLSSSIVENEQIDNQTSISGNTTLMNSGATTGESPSTQVAKYVEIYRNEVRGKRLESREKKIADPTSSAAGENADLTEASSIAESADSEQLDSVSSDLFSQFEFLGGMSEEGNFESTSGISIGSSADSDNITITTSSDEDSSVSKIPNTFFTKISGKKGSSETCSKEVNSTRLGKDSLTRKPLSLAERAEPKISSSRLSDSTTSGDLMQMSKNFPGKEYKQIMHIKFHTDCVRCVTFDQSSSTPILATGSDDTLISLWNCPISGSGTIKQLKPLAVLHGHKDPVLSLCFLPSYQSVGVGSVSSSNGLQLCSSSVDGSIIWWRIDSTNSKITPILHDISLNSTMLNSHQESVWSLSVTSENSGLQSPLLLSCSADGTCAIWNGFDKSTPSATLITVFDASQSQVGLTCGQFCRFNCNQFATAYEENLCIWDVETQKSVSSLHLENPDYASAQSIISLSTHPVEPLIALGWQEKLIQVVDIRVNKPVKDWGVYNGLVTSLSYNCTGQRLSSGHCDGYVYLWDCRTYRPLQNIMAHNMKYDDGTFATNFHSKIDVLASSGADDTAKLFH